MSGGCTHAQYITAETTALTLYATDTTLAELNFVKSKSVTINTTTYDVEATDAKIHSGSVRQVLLKTPVC